MELRSFFVVLLCTAIGGCASSPSTDDNNNQNNNNHAGPVCGNNVVELNETCDDGNTLDGDGCSAVCLVEECGSGVVDPGELCDDGNTAGGDGCSADCLSDESCGNGVTDSAAGEMCDDGNTTGGDGCSADCLSDETCGNGVDDAGEACDDGNTTDGDGCSADCLSDETCGNGVTDAVTGEGCDDGNNANGDGCQADCQLPICGDFITDSGEVCDDGNNVSGDGCSADCLSDESCGNNIADTAAGEECDGTDNAACSGSGCLANCTCSTAGPCADPANVGDPNCRILVIEHTSIGSCGFGRAWRGQDIEFANGALVTGVEFMSSSTSTYYDEMRLMTSVASLSTLAASTNLTKYNDGSNWWEQVAFSAAIAVDPATEYTVWFHLINSSSCTPGCDFNVAHPTWGGHHTDTDPEGQTAGAAPYWNYQYGTNVRVYGVAF